MKVLISNPPWFVPTGTLKENAMRMGLRAGGRWPYTSPGIHKGYFPFPFNMAYADAYLKKKGIKSVLRDSILHLDEYKDFFDFAAKFDYVVLETASASWKNDYYITKEISKNSKVILVGMHATAFANELIKLKEVYAVLKGEYEKSLYACLIGGAGGVYDFDEWENIDDAPFPTRDETTYLYTTPRHPLAVNVWGSRGCPYKCSFCYAECFHKNNLYRPHSPERIEREIKDILRILPRIRYIYFDDDTFNIGNERIREISKMLKQFGLPWGAMCRADTLNLETYAIMYQCGCKELKIGIESGSQRILNDIIHKKLDLKKAVKMIKAIKKIGIHVHGTFMYGFPTESAEEMQMTKRVMAELKCNSQQYSRMGLLSGTEAWKRFEVTHKRQPTIEESDGVFLKGMNK
ncbi:MAG: B12-binding domain-containing radical SAM protein [Candidatus Helarchaeota archaeon]